MAIKIGKEENKFESAEKVLNEHENLEREKAKKVIQSLTGDSGDVKIIQDKTGRVRRVKVKEPRKAFPVYLPVSVFEQLEDVLKKNGKSRNSFIEELIRDYINK